MKHFQVLKSYETELDLLMFPESHVIVGKLRVSATRKINITLKDNSKAVTGIRVRGNRKNVY